jgi:integrase
MKRRNNGEGTPEKMPGGKVRYVTLKDKKIIKGPVRETRAEAAQALAEKLAALENAVPENRKLFITWVRSSIKSRPKLAPTTRETYTYWANALERDPLGQLPVDDITDRELLNWWRNSDLLPVTRKKRVNWILSMLREAGVKTTWRPPRIESESTRRPLSPHERDAIRELIPQLSPELQRFIYLTWFLGLRRSEACALRHDDRDGDGVLVRRTVTYAGGKLHVRALGKSARAFGWVYLPQQLQSEVGPPRTGFVITETEKPPNPIGLSNALRYALQDTPLAKVPRMGSHAMRRTYGMMLLESGADVVTSAQSMRHDPVMLMREYARSRRDLMETAVKNAFETPIHPKTTPKSEN